MKAHEIAEEIAKSYKGSDLNEADTRHQILDRLLHEVLGWPHDAVLCEKYATEGYIDYLLKDSAGRVQLVIEAKREGESFKLPAKIKTSKIQRIRLKTLVTDASIKAAVTQVVGYCPQVGSEYACVTNGHAFIIFRAFIKGRDYFNADALVIPSLKFFAESFTDAINLLSYPSVVKGRSLNSELESKNPLSRDFYYPKNAISHYDAPMYRNAYARFFEPLAKKYFTDISPTDAPMMRACYVYAQGSPEVEAGLHAHLADSLTPYFAGDGGKEISQVRSGGTFAQRIAASIATSKADVVILYGGKGAGKSTFLKRLLYFDPPQELHLHSFPIILDFLQSPQETSTISNFVWDSIVAALNVEHILDGDIANLVELFEDKILVANRQELAAYEVNSTEYIIERNKLVIQWRSDLQYVAKRLQLHWKERRKGIVIAFDNTDQLPPNLQDHCFLVAQNIARQMGCVTVISMREERYCRARTAGVLDAYHNSGYHLAAPDLLLVFTKRLNFLLSELWQQHKKRNFELLPSDVPFEGVFSFLTQCLRQFRDDRNALTVFLRECSRDNTRLALDFFRQFLTSGYTHVEEMIETRGWIVNIHQVIKPMMIPERYNYDENKSLVPNVFQCRNVASGSHFTSLRILRMLRKGLQTTPEKGGFWRIDALYNEFESTFGMGKDFELCVDIFLKHGLVEANNRLDAFSVPATVDGKSAEIFADEIRITAFGVYMHDYLCRSFAYFDLTSLDCGLNSEALYNQFCNDAARELQLGQSGETWARLSSRMRRADGFSRYLQREEDREVAEYLLGEEDRIMGDIVPALMQDIEKAYKSGQRTLGARTNEE